MTSEEKEIKLQMLKERMDNLEESLYNISTRIDNMIEDLTREDE